MPAVATNIVTLDEAKTQLNIDSNVTTFDVQLNDYIAAASQMIVNRIGPVAGSPTVSEWHDGGSTDILLYDEGPIQSVTSVTESMGSVVYTLSQVTLDSGSVTTPFGYTVDLDLGLLVRRAAGVAVPFAAGEANIHVTFVAGYATTPPDITLKTLLLLQRMWETRRGAKPAAGQGPVEASVPTFRALVEELFSDYIVPGIA
jgi:hypothetical protein